MHKNMSSEENGNCYVTDMRIEQICMETKVRIHYNPGNGKIKIEILQFFKCLVQTRMNVYMNNFGLDRYKICWRL